MILIAAYRVFADRRPPTTDWRQCSPNPKNA